MVLCRLLSHLGKSKGDQDPGIASGVWRLATAMLWGPVGRFIGLAEVGRP